MRDLNRISVSNHPYFTSLTCLTREFFTDTVVRVISVLFGLSPKLFLAVRSESLDHGEIVIHVTDVLD